MQMEEPLNIIISGVGGQGNVIASHILASAAVKDGYYVSVGETYGAAQRGGTVLSHVRLSKERQYGPLTPKGRAQIILGLEPIECLRTFGSYGSEETRVIVNPRPVYPIDVLTEMSKYPEVEDVLAALKEVAYSLQVVEATELAKKIGDSIMLNVVMIGCLAGSELTPVRKETLEDAVRETFSTRKPEANLKAFLAGFEEIRKITPS